MLENVPAQAFWRYTDGAFADTRELEAHYGIEMVFMRFDNRF